MNVLEVSGLVAGYGEVEILHGVSIRLAEGEIVTIIGPNGAGKSTLMKAIFGLINIRAGEISLHGEDVTGFSPDRIVQKGVCYVPQSENVFPSLSVQENLEMGGYVRRDGLHQRLEQVYALFPDLAGRRGDRAGKLSGGQGQMLALARALMLDPDVLLLDEPSACLSPMNVEMVFDKIREINQAGTAILIVEQNAREALGLSHRGYVMAMGQNRLEGEAQKLLSNEEVGKVYLGAE